MGPCDPHQSSVAVAAGITPVLLDRHDLYPDVDAPRLRSIEEFEAWLAGPN
jgi:hypothetical protein